MSKALKYKVQFTRRGERKKKLQQVSFEGKSLYRGIKISDYTSMTLAETLAVMSSSIRRYFDRRVKGKALILFNKLLFRDNLKTHCREFPILPQFVGKTLSVHNGKDFVKVVVNEEMIGHRLGEFSSTTRTPKHSKMGVGGSKSSRKIATAKT